MSEKYIKDFDGWNEKKKSLDKNYRGKFFGEKEVWLCCVGVNVGSEQDGKGDMFIRPVYILKKINQKTFLGIPMTSKLKQDSNHVCFYFDYNISSAIVSQIKNLDSRRLLVKIGITSDYLHMKMKKATVALILS